MAPAQQFLDDFKQQYGSLNDVETLIFNESFDSPAIPIDSEKWLMGSHYYDVRSGEGRSQIPIIKPAGYLAIPNSVAGSTAYSASKYNDMGGLRLKQPLPVFNTKGGRAIIVKFQAALSLGGANTFNKIIITLNTAETKEGFKAETGDQEVCENENTGEGIALVYENDNNSAKRYLRVEKLTGSVKGFAKYQTSPTVACNGNTKLAGKFYSTLGNLGTDYDDSSYPFHSWRFFSLNPPPKLPEPEATATAFQYEYDEDPAFKSAEIQFIQKEFSSGEISDTELATFLDHKITINPDGHIYWEFKNTVYTLTLDGQNKIDIDTNYDFAYISIKIHEDAATATKGLTGIKNLIITQK